MLSPLSSIAAGVLVGSLAVFAIMVPYGGLPTSNQGQRQVTCDIMGCKVSGTLYRQPGT